MVIIYGLIVNTVLSYRCQQAKRSGDILEFGGSDTGNVTVQKEKIKNKAAVLFIAPGISCLQRMVFFALEGVAFFIRGPIKPGIYFAELIYGDTKELIRLVKL